MRLTVCARIQQLANGLLFERVIISFLKRKQTLSAAFKSGFIEMITLLIIITAIKIFDKVLVGFFFIPCSLKLNKYSYLLATDYLRWNFSVLTHIVTWITYRSDLCKLRNYMFFYFHFFQSTDPNYLKKIHAPANQFGLA